MNEERLLHLMRRLTTTGLSVAERDELKTFVLSEANREQFIEAAHTLTEESTLQPAPFREENWRSMIQFITQIDKSADNDIHEPVVTPVHFLRTWWFRYAAAVLLLTSGAAVYFFSRSAPKPVAAIVKAPAAIKPAADAAPGTNRAILTLSDGSTIILDSAANGTLAKQGGVEIRKLAKGQIEYNEAGAKPGVVMYNTMSTPRGGQFQITLPDGTEVWLNAASSITYPTIFTGNERKVTVTGEVYFEVVKNTHAPFHVVAEGMEVEVLGTHFNVNAYADEGVARTTLLEGSIRMKTASHQVVIRPGEQAQLTKNTSGNIHVDAGVDVSQVIAWQKGLFEFSDADLPSIMRQVSRWYDVDVAYVGKKTGKKFGGGISRKLPLSNLLRLLEANGVHFELKGKTLTVM